MSAFDENARDRAGGDIEALLERSWQGRGRRLPRRELLFEGAVTACLVALCLLLLVLDGMPLAFGPGAAFALGAYLVASRVTYPLGAGDIVPTQPFLVLLLAVSPPSAVPLMVCAALAAGTLFDAARGRTRADRIVFAGGDAVHALGPALVLTIAGVAGVTSATWPLLAAAFAAQALCDLVSAAVREWVASGVRPQLQARVMAKVSAVDLALTPLGLLAVQALDELVWSPLLLVPLVLLLVVLGRDRLSAVERAHGRLVELEAQRTRLRHAVRRVGEAFGSSLDLDGVLDVIARTASDALSAGTTAAAFRVGERELVSHVDADPPVEAVLRAGDVLHRALASRHEERVTGDGIHAIAVPVEAGDGVLTVLAVVRSGLDFDEDEAALVTFLAERAGLAALNIVRHETLHQQALVDELTGLANHRRFQELLHDAVEGAGRTGGSSALILADLDNFKALNDQHGHHFGDTVLRRVAGCLRAHSRRSDEPARYGGEELAIVLDGASAEDARQLAERIREAVEELAVYGSDGLRVPVSVSIGVSSTARASSDREGVFAAADAALYVAKRSGKNRVVVADTTAGARDDGPHDAPRAHPRRLSEEMPRALSEDELHLLFQPVVDLNSGQPAWAEALLRWEHPTRGTVSPLEFIRATENEGLMPALGRWVIAEAGRSASRWRSAGLELAVGVNVSPSQVAQTDFCEQVRAMLASAELPAEMLVLELTETALFRDVERVRGHLAALRDDGVRIVLDDFGIGHTGPESLLALPLDMVKVPRAFVHRLDHADERERRLGEQVLGLAGSVGFHVVAEGVETEAQRDIAARLGATHAQGFLLAEPMPAASLDCDRVAGPRAA